MHAGFDRRVLEQQEAEEREREERRERKRAKKVPAEKHHSRPLFPWPLLGFNLSCCWACKSPPDCFLTCVQADKEYSVATSFSEGASFLQKQSYIVCCTWP